MKNTFVSGLDITPHLLNYWYFLFASDSEGRSSCMRIHCTKELDRVSMMSPIENNNEIKSIGLPFFFTIWTPLCWSQTTS